MKKTVASELVEKWTLLNPLLNVVYKEIQELSKKKPDSLLNAFKVEQINRVLAPIQELVSNDEMSKFLNMLDTEVLPSNSDVMLVLCQYKRAMSCFENDRKAGPSNEWQIEKQAPKIKK